MKFSFLISFAIFSAGAFLGWRQHEKIVIVRQAHAKVVEESRSLGLEAETLLALGKPPNRTKTDRGGALDREAEARGLTRELIAFVKEMKELEASGTTPDAEAQKKMMQMLARLMNLSPNQIRIVINGLKESQELDDESKEGVIAFSIMMMANDHPEAALAILAEASEMKQVAQLSEHIVSSSLRKWAETDPLAAAEWLRENSEKHPKWSTDATKWSIIAGAMQKDPQIALSLLGTLEIKEEDKQVGALSSGANGPENRDRLIAQLRKDDQHKALLMPTLAALGGRLTEEGFEAGTGWISSAGLSEEETAKVLDGVSAWRTRGDAGKWIEWMSDKLPEERLVSKTGEMIRHWAREDYRAAGDWINQTAEGPAKQAAMNSYAETLAPYEPDAAAEWALALPAGGNRDQLLKKVHEEWKKKDEAAAAEFAREHGIGE